MWFVYCHVTESKARVYVVRILPCYRTQGKGICGLYNAMLQNPRLGYVWFVYCHVTEPKARVFVVFIMSCYRIQG